MDAPTALLNVMVIIVPTLHALRVVNQNLMQIFCTKNCLYSKQIFLNFRYLNGGKDVWEAQHVMEAIKDCPGVISYNVELIQPEESHDDMDWSGPGISTLQSFEYPRTGNKVKVWQTYDVGAGVQVELGKVDVKKLPSLKVLSSNENQDFTPIKPRKSSTQKGNNENIFHCPDSGCDAMFPTYEDLSNHVDFERHNYKVKNPTPYDRAVLKYATNLMEGAGGLQNQNRDTGEYTQMNGINEKKGFALHARKEQKRLNSKQIQFLTKQFDKKIETGIKAKPKIVSKYMQNATNQDGTKVFTVKEYLTPQQIGNFFSREAAKRKKIMEGDYEALRHLKTLKNMREQAFVDNH